MTRESISQLEKEISQTLHYTLPNETESFQSTIPKLVGQAKYSTHVSTYGRSVVQSVGAFVDDLRLTSGGGHVSRGAVRLITA